jgi:hypothetical protein
MYRSILLTAIMLLTTILSKAQNGEAEMADVMRSNGKIYVVVLVLATIFAGIIALLVRMERKITRLEKNK